jgi:cell division protease FtsH
VVPRPDVRGRTGILAVHTKKTPLAPGVDLDIIARGTPGFSGADLENLVNEAALLAARNDKSQLDMHDFEMAKDKVLMGPERRSMIISDKEKRNTAYHEAGHALVAKLMKHADPVHKVTIIPRGRALGLTQSLPAEDRLSMSADAANDTIAMAMGGRIAEEVIFGQLTTGAASDIQSATDLARKMVCDWGMSEKLGPLHFGRREGEVFLGRDFGDSTKEYSEQTAVDIDGEVRKIVTANYDRAKKVIVDNLDRLKLLAEALLEYETVDGGEIDVIWSGQKLNRTLAPAATPTAPSKAAEKPPRPSIFAPPRPVPDKA